MLVKYRVNNAITFDRELPALEEAFQFVAACDSIFGIKECGNCHCVDEGNLRFVHRTPKGFDFYSLKCNACGYELKISKTKEDHRLYPVGWEAPYDGSRARDGGETPDNQETKPAAKPKDKLRY